MILYSMNELLRFFSNKLSRFVGELLLLISCIRLATVLAVCQQSYCWHFWSCTWINIYFKLKSGVSFWKRDFKIKSSWSVCWPSLRPEKKHKMSRHVPPLKMPNFFSMLVVIILTNNTQYTTNCTNLHPTPTSDPLAKVKLAFCTSS